MDLERRRHGYISDEQTISSSMSYGGLLTGGKKPKPVPPRKPSFLYLNRASSLQSVNGVVKTNSMDRSSNKIDPKGKHLEAESWNNNTAPKTSLKTLSGNLKWNILSSSRTKNAGSSRDREPREWCRSSTYKLLSARFWAYLLLLNVLYKNVLPRYKILTNHICSLKSGTIVKI